MRHCIGNLAERLYNHASECERVHRGTFDGWWWLQIEHGAAFVADWLTPIAPR